MADNAPNTSWFRSFGRSSSSTAKQPPPQQPPPQPPTLQTRHTSPRLPTPISTPTESPTTESPPSRPHHNHHQHHHHRKSAGATLRTVSSFLSLKSNNNNSNSKSGGRASPSVAVADTVPEPMLRTPASLAMLPLTEVDYSSSSWSDGYGARARARTGSGSSRGGNWKGGAVGVVGEEEEEGGGKKGGEGTWHNPGLMQMAEMLSSVMARMGCGERLDPTYHSCVLSLIEGFYRLTRKLRDTEDKLAELKELRERELEQFRGMTEEWMETGEAYKAEVKRLELALARESKDGVASVALARHGSLVDRAGSKRFHARLVRLNNLQSQDTAKEEQSPSAAEPIDLAEATTSYRTLGAIPRVLDSQNDVALSRIVEQREFDEWLTHRQQRHEGRVRAAPVLVRPGGAPEPRQILRETLRGRRSPNPVGGLDAFREVGLEDALTNDIGQPSHQPSLSTDHESSSSSSSSDSSTSTEAESAQSAFSLGGKSKGQPKQAKKKQSDSSEASDRPRKGKGKGKLPRLRIESEQSSRQESLLGPPLDKKERRRCYSFDKGDDEILSVTSPTFPQDIYGPPMSPAGEEAPTRAETNEFLTVVSGLGMVTPNGEGGVSGATPSSSLDSGSMRHSSSTNTVKWVGEDGGDGADTPEGSNTGYGHTDGGA